METIVATRKYRGFVIETVQQESGRKTYDVRTLDGELVELGCERLAVARAHADAEIGED